MWKQKRIMGSSCLISLLIPLLHSLNHFEPWRMILQWPWHPAVLVSYQSSLSLPGLNVICLIASDTWAWFLPSPFFFCLPTSYSWKVLYYAFLHSYTMLIKQELWFSMTVRISFFSTVKQIWTKFRGIFGLALKNAWCTQAPSCALSFIFIHGPLIVFQKIAQLLSSKSA